MTATVPQEWIALAGQLADAARPIARRYFRAGVDVDTKADESPVTIADRSIERAMRDLIEARFPDHGIIGEEYGTVRGEAETVWVLDPIDGTQAFINGVPTFGTLIAACRGGAPVLGVIDQPILEERWLGVAGEPTLFQGEPVKTRSTEMPGEATLYATHPDMFEATGCAGDFARLAGAVERTRFGVDCYAYGLVACGWTDMVVEASLQPYDYCAVVPVIEGAGGAMTDWAGRPLTTASDGRVIAAATPALAEAARSVLAG